MHAPRSNMSVSCHLDPPVPAASRSPALYHQSIIRTGRDVRPLRLYKCIEGERREPVRRRCGGALGWSLVSGAPAVRWWCARVVLSGPIQIGHRDQPAARPDAARVPGRGRFAARGRGWRLPLVPRFAPVAPAPAPERDGWFAYPPVLCRALRGRWHTTLPVGRGRGRCTLESRRVLDRTDRADATKRRCRWVRARGARVRGARRNWWRPG